MKVAVLGCGPAGLLATHAAVLQGCDPVVYSIANRSETNGAMYLHRAIPDLTSPEPDGMLTYLKMGTQAGYARKVYGSPDAPCSWSRFLEGPVPAWSLAAAYDELWYRYHSRIIEHRIHSLNVEEIIDEYPLVISSIPAGVLCRKPYHKFMSVNIWIRDKAPAAIRPGEIIYNGAREQDWYRSSDIFGYRSTEYGEQYRPGTPGMGLVKPGLKPTCNNCDCWDGLLLKVGRYGRWEKNQLTHMAFEDADKCTGEKNALHKL